MTYQTFAHIYDEVMDHEQYQLWVKFTKNSFKTYTSRNIQKVMELACGTGEVSTLLTEAGYQVTGVDLSSEMLDICLLYTSPSPRDLSTSRMPSSA